MWCENTSAKYLSSNPRFHTRTEHTEVGYHFVRENVLEIDFILTGDYVANDFTKTL